MFKLLQKTVGKSEVGFRPETPPGKRAYAVGDVHGRLDLLDDLLTRIERDIATRPTKETHIIFLGDLIDRGPASRQVIERLMDYRPAGAKCHYLMGNHEEVLVRGLRGEPDMLNAWLEHGGDTTAKSYGLDVAYLRSLELDSIEHALLSAVPDAHIRFMAGFLDSIRFGDYFLVHAGIRPGYALEDQSPRDMRWIRKEFTENDRHHGCVVVHGHTVEDSVANHHNRLGLDTGAYRTGVLSAARLEDHAVDIIQAHEDCAALA